MIYFWQTFAIFQLEKSDSAQRKFDFSNGPNSPDFQKNKQYKLPDFSVCQQGKSLTSSSQGQAKVERMKSCFTSCCMSLQMMGSLFAQFKDNIV
jgi:hypothetical protein